MVHKQIWLTQEQIAWLKAEDQPTSMAALLRIAVRRLIEDEEDRPVTTQEIAWAREIMKEGK